MRFARCSRHSGSLRLELVHQLGLFDKQLVDLELSLWTGGKDEEPMRLRHEATRVAARRRGTLNGYIWRWGG